MSATTVYRCDECGAERKEANHWFTSTVCADGSLDVARWCDVFAEELINPTTKHLCGESCLAKFVSKWAKEAA